MKERLKKILVKEYTELRAETATTVPANDAISALEQHDQSEKWLAWACTESWAISQMFCV